MDLASARNLEGMVSLSFVVYITPFPLTSFWLGSYGDSLRDNIEKHINRPAATPPLYLYQMTALKSVEVANSCTALVSFFFLFYHLFYVFLPFYLDFRALFHRPPMLHWRQSLLVFDTLAATWTFQDVFPLSTRFNHLCLIPIYCPPTPGLPPRSIHQSATNHRWLASSYSMTGSFPFYYRFLNFFELLIFQWLFMQGLSNRIAELVIWIWVLVVCGANTHWHTW